MYRYTVELFARPDYGPNDYELLEALTMTANSVVHAAIEIADDIAADLDWGIAYIWGVGHASCYVLYNLAGVCELYPQNGKELIFSYETE
jgi:hypothetical protein